MIWKLWDFEYIFSWWIYSHLKTKLSTILLECIIFDGWNVMNMYPLLHLVKNKSNQQFSSISLILRLPETKVFLWIIKFFPISHVNLHNNMLLFIVELGNFILWDFEFLIWCEFWIMNLNFTFKITYFNLRLVGNKIRKFRW